MNRIATFGIRTLKSNPLFYCNKNFNSTFTVSKVLCRNFTNTNSYKNHYYQEKKGETVNAGLNTAIKIGVPVILIIIFTYLVLQGERSNAKDVAMIEENLIQAARKEIDTTVLGNHVKIGSFSFSQRDVEHAFNANPDKFIQDVVNVSISTEKLDENEEAEKYRALCLFARCIVLVDSACTTAVLKKAKQKFEETVKSSNK